MESTHSRVYNDTESTDYSAAAVEDTFNRLGLMQRPSGYNYLSGWNVSAPSTHFDVIISSSSRPLGA